MECVLAVDPGRDKCGVAVVEREGLVLHKRVILRSQLTDVASELVKQYPVTRIVVGNGTTSKEVMVLLGNLIIHGRDLSVIKVDEYRSTDEARAYYWVENPPKGWKKLIPVSMQVPPVPVDDYVAVILAKRYLKNRQA